MYCPAAFRQDDLPSLHAQIQSSGLAIVTSTGAQGLQASHLPLLLEPGEGAAGAEALVVFSGADAYVHPGWYPAKAEHGKVVPTWNYIAVHAWGQAEVFDEPERLLELVSRLSDRHEQGRAQPWAVSDAPREYIDAMLRAIVGFALPIRRLEGKWKLSQNRSASDQAGVRTGLATSNNPRDHELAAQMNPAD